MPDTLWSAKVVSVGRDAHEMLAAGILILFADPVPEALTDVSVVHSGAKTPTRPVAVGDLFDFADQRYTLDEVGQRAHQNLVELGHLVIYVNQPDQQLLPGAIKATGPAMQPPAIGSAVAFTAH